MLQSLGEFDKKCSNECGPQSKEERGCPRQGKNYESEWKERKIRTKTLQLMKKKTLRESRGNPSGF